MHVVIVAMRFMYVYIFLTVYSCIGHGKDKSSKECLHKDQKGSSESVAKLAVMLVMLGMSKNFSKKGFLILSKVIFNIFKKY